MIAVACDSAAFELKQEVIAFLKNKCLEFKDYGCFTPESCDYPDFALAVALAVSGGECEKGILLCGTGIGMSMAANKVRGVRCAACGDLFSARATREHNDANIIALGARVLDSKDVLAILGVFLDTPFSGEERHMRRVNKITMIEDRFFK